MAEPKKLFDVAHPGKTPATATSRPIIVGHGPMMKDPMVQEKEDSVPEKPRPITVSHEKTVEASADLKLTEAKKDEPEPTEEKSPVATIEQPPQKTETPRPAAEETPAREEEKTDNSSDAAVIDSVAGQAVEKKKQDELDKKIQEEQVHITELIATKKYFVPINVAKHKRGNRLAIVILLLLLVAVAAGYAVQSGLVEL